MEIGNRGCRGDMINRVDGLRILSTLSVTCFIATGCMSLSSSGSAPVNVNDMKFVAGGTFRVGSDLGELESIRAATGLPTTDMLMAEVSSRVVTVSDFYMDTYDVTNQDFAQFLVAIPAWNRAKADSAQHNGRYLEHWGLDGPPNELRDHPVTFVTWQAALAYCEWRGKRLPSEAEFEWAAQDGKTRIEYPWGNAPPRDDLVNWGGDEIDTTVPVGSYPPNARGLHDMSGNVWHFTADPWRGNYAEMLARPTGTQQPAENLSIRRVVRGGSWGANAANLRVRYRDSHRPSDAREMVGFRCVKSANGE